MSFFRFIFSFIAVASLLTSCGMGSSSQLDAFKNLDMCEGQTLGYFLETASVSHEWQDMETDEYGDIVGFVADFKKDGGESIRVGFQANYQQSALDDTVWSFTPVAFEMMNIETKKGMPISTDIAFYFLKVNICGTYRVPTDEELERKKKRAEERKIEEEKKARYLREEQIQIQKRRLEMSKDKLLRDMTYSENELSTARKGKLSAETRIEEYRAEIVDKKTKYQETFDKYEAEIIKLEEEERAFLKSEKKTGRAMEQLKISNAQRTAAANLKMEKLKFKSDIGSTGRYLEDAKNSLEDAENRIRFFEKKLQDLSNKINEIDTQLQNLQ